SETVKGTLHVPYDGREPLVVALDYLRLPAPPEDGPLTELLTPDELMGEEERVDPLLDFDPRTLPRMRFTAAEILRGQTDYGTWQFDLTPGPGGAEFTNLVVAARGLRI